MLSSPWCRCLDTARLLDLGPVQATPAFGNVFVLADQRAAILAEAAALLRAWRGPGSLLVVTHGATIQGLTGVSPASGEIVVVRVGADGRLDPVGRIPFRG